MRIVQKGKEVKNITSNPTTELDKFIRRVQIRSRATMDGKIIRMEPLQEKLKLNLTPSEYRYKNCPEVSFTVYPAMTRRVTI